jgi:endonuclease/exonuclease/phosphatase family metal-dependent hydrolase
MRVSQACVLSLCLGAFSCSSGTTTPNGGAGGGGASTAGASGSGVTAGSPAGGTGGGASGGSDALGGQAGGGAGSGGSAGNAGGGAGGAGGSGGAAPMLELRITSSNIRYGTASDGINVWDERKALLFQVLTEQMFDSAGLQEALAFQLEELDAALPAYARVGVGRDDGEEQGEFSAILYNEARYEAVSSGTFWFSDTPEVPGSMSWGNTLPRICSWVRLKHLETGRHYYHFNLHLDHLSQPSREKSAQLLAKRIAERPDQADPVVVTGDFNAEPDNLAITYLLGTAMFENAQTPFKVEDAWLKLHAADTNSTTYHAWNGGMTGGTHIDYVMFGPGITAKSAEIIFDHEGDIYPSDHYPVSAVFTLPAQ